VYQSVTKRLDGEVPKREPLNSVYLVPKHPVFTLSHNSSHPSIFHTYPVLCIPMPNESGLKCVLASSYQTQKLHMLHFPCRYEIINERGGDKRLNLALVD
jgi:hypothetical protein